MHESSKLDEALALERLRPSLPKRPEVLDVRHEPYVDSLGEHELMIVVVLANDTRDEEMNTQNLQAIREAIHKALREDRRFPYIRFLTEEESTDSDEE